MAEDEDAAAGGAGPAGPFLREYAPARGFPQVNAQRASVLFYRSGGYSVVTVSGVQHVDKRALARPYIICEIALGTYVAPLQMELPAAGGTTFFKAEVDIQWTVTDPYLAALEVVTDVAGRLTSPVRERLRELTTTYRVTEAEQANRAITRECAGGRWADLGSELGLRVRLYVRLRVDGRTTGHADEERDAHAQANVTRLRREEFRHMLQGGELEQLSYMLAADPDGPRTSWRRSARRAGRTRRTVSPGSSAWPPVVNSPPSTWRHRPSTFSTRAAWAGSRAPSGRCPSARIPSSWSRRPMGRPPQTRCRTNHPDDGPRTTDGPGRTKMPKPTSRPPAWVMSLPPPLSLPVTGISARQRRRPPPTRTPPERTPTTPTTPTPVDRFRRGR
ncbi:hypothetical protein [Streptomyces sp. NBC_01483]|uniref:hypothetical protein n=1 Tax=Streptomyces sp. NBC_01483 TaxID=2903883 RepID=UPI002E37423C|nr:hypothetical protein [Streptomyces sp. NBC_01483]